MCIVISCLSVTYLKGGKSSFLSLASLERSAQCDGACRLLAVLVEYRELLAVCASELGHLDRVSANQVVLA